MSNGQPGSATKTVFAEQLVSETIAVLSAIAVALRTGVDDIRVCPHDDRDGCRGRKPAPGMLVDAAASWSLDLSRSSMVGDRWRDIEAGHRAGCRSVLIDRRYPAGRGAAVPEAVVTDLGEAVRWILADSRQPGRI